MTKYFVNDTGEYVGGFDGTEPPANSIEVPEPPEHGLMKHDGGAWIDTPASTNAKNRKTVNANKLADLLESKGVITPAERLTVNE